MKRKLITTVLLINIFLFIAVSTVYSQTGLDLSAFKVCRKLCFDNNDFGSFIYGFDNTTLYSASVFPNGKLFSVNTTGKIYSTAHSNGCSYALSEKSGKYFVTELDSIKGTSSVYSFGQMNNVYLNSFAFCDGKAYFIFTDSEYSYIKSYNANGSFIKKYSFNGSNVKRLFTNNFKVYALLSNGSVYRLDANGTQYCTSINASYDFCIAGAGYIFSEVGTLTPLDGSSTSYRPSAKLNCILMCGGAELYSEGKTVYFNSSGEKSYKTGSEIQALFYYDNKVGFLNADYTVDTVRLSSFSKDRSELPTQSNSNSESKIIISDGHISQIKAGTTVKVFKSRLGDEITIFDRSGNKVTSGKLKTGYYALISSVQYEIAVNGDITGEGNVKSNDLSALMAHFVGKSELSGVFLTAADYNNDGKINNADLVSIARNPYPSS